MEFVSAGAGLTSHQFISHLDPELKNGYAGRNKLACVTSSYTQNRQSTGNLVFGKRFFSPRAECLSMECSFCRYLGSPCL